jgi:hypothetical protein
MIAVSSLQRICIAYGGEGLNDLVKELSMRRKLAHQEIINTSNISSSNISSSEEWVMGRAIAMEETPLVQAALLLLVQPQNWIIMAAQIEVEKEVEDETGAKVPRKEGVKARQSRRRRRRECVCDTCVNERN